MRWRWRWSLRRSLRRSLRLRLYVRALQKAGSGDGSATAATCRAVRGRGRAGAASTGARQAAPVPRHERHVALARDARHAAAPPALSAQRHCWLLRLPGTITKRVPISYVFCTLLITHIYYTLPCFRRLGHTFHGHIFYFPMSSIHRVSRHVSLLDCTRTY